MSYASAENRCDAIPTARRAAPPQAAGHLARAGQQFGDDKPLEVQRAVLRRASDRGVAHFDLANSYDPPYGSADSVFNRWSRAASWPCSVNTAWG